MEGGRPAGDESIFQGLLAGQGPTATLALPRGDGLMWRKLSASDFSRPSAASDQCPIAMTAHVVYKVD